jgi:hypothetical protein
MVPSPPEAEAHEALRRRLGALIGHSVAKYHDVDVGFLCPLLFLSSWKKTKDRTTTFFRHRAFLGAVGSIQAVWKDQRETEPSVTES